MQIRPATQDDIPAVLDIVAPILRAGDTYAIDTDMTDDDVIAYWMGKDKVTLVAEEDGAVVGTYYIRQNQGGGGSHVCNCGAMTAPAAVGAALHDACVKIRSCVPRIWGTVRCSSTS